MAGTAVRWNLVVAPQTDRDLRRLIAEEGGKKGDLSRFVEDAVKARIFELTAEKAKAANEHLSAEEIQDMVDEAVAWARRR